MTTVKPRTINPCSGCAGNCTNCTAKGSCKPNKLEKLVHKILKTTPLGCDGESWRCFLKSKHMFLYGASALVFFAIGNTTNAIFERKVQDWLFPDKPADNLEQPKSAFHPQTQEYFKIKAIIRNMDTGEKTAILESVPLRVKRPQKITSRPLPVNLQNFGEAHNL